MTLPLWITETAEQFWKLAGISDPPFPRPLQQIIPETLGLTIHALPQLRIAQVQDWLARRKITIPLPKVDRALRGCLIAHKGTGFILVEAEDPTEERYFTLAHELAHFLRDYQQPRQQIKKQMGESGLDLFDGRRKPEFREKLASILRNMPLQPKIHLMERTPHFQRDVTNCESAADRLALELIAPMHLVQKRIGHFSVGAIVSLLCEEFSLPKSIAEGYAQEFVEPPESPGLQRLIGLLSQ